MTPASGHRAETQKPWPVRSVMAGAELRTLLLSSVMEKSRGTQHCAALCPTPISGVQEVGYGLSQVMATSRAAKALCQETVTWGRKEEKRHSVKRAKCQGAPCL